MTDPLSALASTATIVSSVRQAIDAIVSHAKAADDSDLLKSVIPAQIGFIDLQNSIQDRDDRIRELLKKVRSLEEIGKLVHSGGCYWEQQGEGWDGPFCTRCADVDKLKVRLADWSDDRGSPYFACPKCENSVQSRLPPPP